MTGDGTLSGGTLAVVFPETLPGVAADYTVIITEAANYAYASAVATTGFTANGTGSDTFTWILVRHTNATVSGGPPGVSVP